MNQLHNIPIAVAEQFLSHLQLEVQFKVEGGLSDSRVWKCTGAGGSFALRAWGRMQSNSIWLTDLHRHLQAARDLPFVPQPVIGKNGSTILFYASQAWELTTWMPGTACNQTTEISDSKLRNAAAALAEIHRRWYRPQLRGESPTILDRLKPQVS